MENGFAFLFIYLKFIFLKIIYLFMFGCIGSSLLHAGFFQLQRAGFSLWWLLLWWSTGSRLAGFSSCSTQAQQLWLGGSRAQAQQLWRTALLALRHVGSSRTRAQTSVPCIGRRILNHCATREALDLLFIDEETDSQTGGVAHSRSCNRKLGTYTHTRVCLVSGLTLTAMRCFLNISLGASPRLLGTCMRAITRSSCFMLAISLDTQASIS